MAKMGRPSIYTDELAATILGRISNGESLRSITMEEGMPNPDTIYVWLLKRPDFAENYTRAREEQADTLADEILTIADETPDSVTDEKGISRTDSGWVTWQRNRVDARKWVASKLKPKKYGDRVAMEGVEGGAPITTQDATADKFLEIIRNLEIKKRAG